MYLHGTKADLAVGDPGAGSRIELRERPADELRRLQRHSDAAVWGAELAGEEDPGRIYIVEPTGTFEDDPNLTDKKFPGNPTRSFRSPEPLRVVGELVDWVGIRPRSSGPCEPHSLRCSRTDRRRSRTKSRTVDSQSLRASCGVRTHLEAGPSLPRVPVLAPRKRIRYALIRASSHARTPSSWVIPQHSTRRARAEDERRVRSQVPRQAPGTGPPAPCARRPSFRRRSSGRSFRTS